MRRALIIDGDVARVPVGTNAKDGYALIDISMVDEVAKSNWHSNGAGYVVAKRNGVKVRLHHLVLGYPPEGTVTDHVNHSKLDNRINNLRHVSQTENNRNASIRKDNTSGYVGVVWNKQRSKWQAKVFRGKTIHLGFYNNIKEAVKMRDKYLNDGNPNNVYVSGGIL